MKYIYSETSVTTDDDEWYVDCWYRIEFLSWSTRSLAGERRRSTDVLCNPSRSFIETCSNSRNTPHDWPTQNSVVNGSRRQEPMQYSLLTGWREICSVRDRMDIGQKVNQNQIPLQKPQIQTGIPNIESKCRTVALQDTPKIKSIHERTLGQLNWRVGECRCDREVQIHSSSNSRWSTQLQKHAMDSWSSIFVEYFKSNGRGLEISRNISIQICWLRRGLYSGQSFFWTIRN